MRRSIDGAVVRLRALDRDDLAWYDNLAVTSEYDDFGQRPPFNSLPRWLEDRLLTDDHGTMVVERLADGERLGTTGWRSVSWGPSFQSRAIEIGISLIPEARGQGYGTEAQWLLVRFLFRETSVNRVQATTDVTNKREQRALEKVGFAPEGILRGSQYRQGGYHDLVLYSVLRDEFG